MLRNVQVREGLRHHRPGKGAAAAVFSGRECANRATSAKDSLGDLDRARESLEMSLFHKQHVAADKPAMARLVRA